MHGNSYQRKLAVVKTGVVRGFDVRYMFADVVINTWVSISNVTFAYSRRVRNR